MDSCCTVLIHLNLNLVSQTQVGARVRSFCTVLGYLKKPQMRFKLVPCVQVARGTARQMAVVHY
jgi:hypothetical protein